MQHHVPAFGRARTPIICLLLFVLGIALIGCNSINISGGNSTDSSGANGSGFVGSTASSSSNSIGSGVQGVQVFVEPDAGDAVITSAIAGAKKTILLEMYLLTERKVISALEEAANRGVDVRVML